MVSSPSSIKCPACQSEIGSDGKSLISRSPHLVALEDAAERFEKALARLERDAEAERKKDAVESLEKKPADAGRKSWLKRG